MEVEPGEICLVPRGMMFKVELMNGPARGYICEEITGPSSPCPSRADRRQLPGQSARLQRRRSPGYEGQGDALPRACEVVRQVLHHRDWPFAARRGGVARQLHALQIRSEDLFSGRRGSLFDHTGPVDFHGAHGAKRRGRHGQHRLRHLPAALDGGRAHVSAALVPPQHHERSSWASSKASTTPRKRVSCPAA